MKTFLKILRVLFVVLGIIFFLLIIAGFYLYQSDFYGIKTIVNYEQKESIDTGDTYHNDKNSTLSTEQENQLERVGIDPATVPTEISPEMEECFVDKLGEKRVREIAGGASPNALEIVKVEPCLEAE